MLKVEVLESISFPKIFQYLTILHDIWQYNSLAAQGALTHRLQRRSRPIRNNAKGSRQNPPGLFSDIDQKGG